MSTFERLAEIPVSIDSYELQGLRHRVSSAFERRTTVVRLHGAGDEGVGEDPTYDGGDQQAFQQAGPTLPLAGRHTLDGFSELLDGLEMFPAGPSQPAYLDYRRWAFESAALDLALRQAGLTLASVLGIEAAPVRFVVSRGLGVPPNPADVLRWLELYPGVGLKLDATSAWDDALVERLAATGAVSVLDLKGAYKGTPVDQPADPALYRRVVRGFPDAWIEDPDLTPDTEAVLAGDRGRITWDAPIHSVDDIRGLPFAPGTLNFKPSRFGSLRRLFDGYDYCREAGIGIYGGGQYELGPGRGQIQYLASLFHADAPNDVSPVGYHDSPATGLAGTPLRPATRGAGFRWGGD